MKNKDSAVIIGTYINAYSIYKGLKEISFQGDIYAIDTRVEKTKTFLEVMTDDVKVIKKKLETVEDIIEIVNSISADKRYMFFTDEECIDIIKEAITGERISGVVAFTGSGIDNKLIFNRYEFYQFIEKNQLAIVPQTISSDVDPFDTIGNRFIIRPNNSWEDNIKTPRLSIVESKEQLEEIEQGYLKLGMKRNMWCYQEVLSSESKHNLSVCGWYDEEEKLFLITRKVVQHPPKTGCGDVVEVVEKYPHKLLEYAENILAALKYRGPFELEFVYDINTGRYCVIELNPRFWMQHELVEKNSDYYLIRKSLNQQCKPHLDLKYKYWINTNQLIYRLLKGQIGIIRYLKQSIKAPGVRNSLKWTKYYFRLKKEMDRSY